MKQRIGIYSGSFDPVHRGHIAFAQEAIKTAKLDRVFFLPEIKPREKNPIHYAHRVAMLNLAVKAHSMLEVLELPDKKFKVLTTLPKLKQRYPKTKLFFLVGSDVAEQIEKWPQAKALLKQAGLIIASRTNSPSFSLPEKPAELFLIKSKLPNVSSTQIRESIQQKKVPNGLINETKNYIKENWLYSSVDSSRS